MKQIRASELKSTVKPYNVFVHVHCQKIQFALRLNQTRQRLEVEQVMSAAGRLQTSHGAMNLGKANDFVVARVLPSQFCTCNMMDTREKVFSYQLSNLWQWCFSHAAFLQGIEDVIMRMVRGPRLCLPRSPRARNFYFMSTCSVWV